MCFPFIARYMSNGLTSGIPSKTSQNVQSSRPLARQLSVQMGSELTEESKPFTLVDEFNVNL